MSNREVGIIGLILFCATLSSSPLSTTRAEDQVAVIEHPDSTESPKSELDKLAQGKQWRDKLKPGQRVDGINLEDEDLNRLMLTGTRFRKGKLKGANLEMAMLAGADFRQADLEYANLKGAMLLGANLSGAKLVNAKFDEANLFGASLEGARVEGASFKNAFITQDQIDEACGQPRALPQGLRMPKPCK